MRTARLSRKSFGVIAASIAGLAAMSVSDSAHLLALIDTRPVAIAADHGASAVTAPAPLLEPVPAPVAIQRDMANQPGLPTAPENSTRGMGRTRDDYINAAAAISQHVASLDIPIPREVVRIVALPPIDTRRLPEQPLAMRTADPSGLFDLAALSMAAMPAPAPGVLRTTTRKQSASVSRGGIKRVAGFVKRSNVPPPVRVSHPVPTRTLVGSGTLRPAVLRTPMLTSSSAAIVTSAHMVLAGQ